MTQFSYTFNTGCLYTKEGQVITMRSDTDTGITLFYDHSRGVYGSVPYVAIGNRHHDAVFQEVMDHYLHNRYDHSAFEARELKRGDIVIPYHHEN